MLGEETRKAQTADSDTGDTYYFHSLVFLRPKSRKVVRVEPLVACNPLLTILWSA